MRSARAALTLSSFVFLACADASTIDAGAEVGREDGWAGDVVVIPPEHLTDAPTLRLQEELRIGSLDGPEETQHFRVVDVAMIGDELWVLDHGDEEIRVYGPSGDYIRTVGGGGDGPGEFRSPRNIEVHGDTIAVGDARRISYFSRDGEVLGSVTSILRSEEGSSYGVMSAGTTWIRERTSPFVEGRTDVLYRDTTRLYTSDTPEEFGELVLAYEGPEQMVTGQIGFVMRPFFGAYPVFNVGRDGRIYHSPAADYRVDVVDAETGAPVRRIVGFPERLPVTDGMVQRAWDIDRERYADPRPGSEAEMYAEVAARRLDLPVPEFRPVVRRLVPAADGSLLVGREDLDPDPLETGDATFWDVLDSDGGLVGRFTAAPEIRVMGFHDGRVLALERDDLGVPYVTIYRLVGS